MIKKQFTIYLENKPGRLARLTKMLAKEKINIEGISVSESTDVGLVQVVPSNAARTRSLLRQAGVPYTVQDVCLLPLADYPGSLCKVVSKLGAAGININYVYATSCQGNAKCHVVLSSPDLAAVEKAWLSD